MLRFPKLFLVLVFLISAVLLQGGCAKNVTFGVPQEKGPAKKTEQTLQQTSTVHLRLYFLSAQGDYLVPVTYVANSGKNSSCYLAVEKLLAGVGREIPLQRVLPEGTKLRNINFNSEGSIAYVDFTDEFKKIDNPVRLNLALDAVTLTLTDVLPGTKGVKFSVEGKTPSDFLGEDLSLPRPRPQINLKEKKEAQNPVVVYFKEKDSSFTVPFTYEAKGQTAEEKMYFALQKLIDGPPFVTLEDVFPSSARILSLSFDPLQETVTVNFNSDVLNQLQGQAQEEAFLHSILYTLGSFNGVDKVEILIDGQVLTSFPSGWTFASPVEVPPVINLISS